MGTARKPQEAAPNWLREPDLNWRPPGHEPDEHSGLLHPATLPCLVGTVTMVGPVRIELTTSALSRRHSTAELRANMATGNACREPFVDGRPLTRHRPPRPQPTSRCPGDELPLARDVPKLVAGMGFEPMTFSL